MAVISNNEIHVKYVLDTTQLQAATQAMSGITAEERKLLADLKKLQAQLQATGQTGTNAGNNVSNSFAGIGETVKQLIPVFSVAFAVDKLKQFAQYAFDTAMKFEQMGKTLAFVTGGVGKANEQFSYMTALAKNMGLNVQALTDGFKGFAAAASFAGVSQENINRQMLAFTKAASALSLSAEDTKLMFTALGQMYSKNKIQAEELRGQLGERLPGSMELLAKSMKIPVTALDEMLKKGQIITKDVMPAFAKEVELAFGIAAAKTDTFTAGINRMFTSFETAIVRIMEGGIGDMVKFVIDRLAAISDFVKFVNQDTFQNQSDYFNARKVEVEKNVLFEIEATRKAAKEKEGIELTVAEAAQRILEDKKKGEEAFFKFQGEKYAQAAKDAGQLRKGDMGLLAFGDDLKRAAKKTADISKAAANTIFSPFEVLSKGLPQVFTENMVASMNSFNRETENQIELGRTRLKQLIYLADEGKKQAAAQDEEAAEKEGKALKNRYQRELQMLELQEKIRRLYAQASIENEFERSQALLKIGAEFNEKKRAVDDRYYKESFNNESQAMKDLRELTNNNSNLRKAENASLYADIRRNEDAYHKEAYEKEKKALERLQNQRDKNAEKLVKKKGITLDEEYKLIESNYQKDIDAAVQNSKNIIANDALLDDKKKELLDKNYTLLNQLFDDKNVERNEAQKKHDEDFIKDMLRYLDEKEKLRKKDYEAAKNALDEQNKFNDTGLETSLLAEKNYYRFKKANSQEMNLLEKKQAEERIENQMSELNKSLKIEEQFYDIPGSEARQKQILADMKLLEEEKTAIQLDYADKRKQYEIQVLQESLDLASQMVTGMMDLRSQQLDKELQMLQTNADEEIRLADGNKQKIDMINQKRRDEEKRIKTEQFRANQTAAVADVIFRTAPIIAQYAAGLITGPLAILAAGAAAAQIGFILSQPTPEYAKGTRGKKHKGGPAIVGEIGVEKVITESGKVYYTPPTATLLDLPKGSQVIPNNMLNKEELYWASTQSNRSGGARQANKIEYKLDEIGSILKNLPIHQINMDERGFEKFVRTERRTTKILNNRFPQKN
jgi:tape measure domain-containing protein